MPDEVLSVLLRLLAELGCVVVWEKTATGAALDVSVGDRRAWAVVEVDRV